MAMTMFREMSDLERRMEDLFEGLDWPRPFRLLWPELAAGTRPFPPTTDVFPRDGDLVVRLELPGIDPARDVTVTLEGGTLVVAGERRQRTEVKEEDFYRMESRYGTFQRRITLPEGIDETMIAAEYRDGIMEVVVKGGAKGERKEKGATIPIEVKPGK